MKLLLVESPAKCKKITEYLGSGYKVLASMGHIRSLDETLDAVGIDRDFEPTFAFLKEKAKAIAAIKEAAAAADEVILAADDDREGEAIAYSVAALLRLNVATTKRAVFHEITKQAISKAVANPRTLDMNRVYAQQARAQLDMMIGFTISPLLWRHVARGLSAGRCQTPALRFVIEREKEVAAHTTSSSWHITGTWTAGGDQKANKQFQAKLTDELEDEESATNYLEMLCNAPTATVKSLTVKPWSEAPPAPLITSSLQQQASALFRSSPKNTMHIAQRLYEAGHITYMRTDKAVLSDEAVAEAHELISRTFGPEYVGSSRTASKKDTNAQEAHEAIRPTHFDVEALAGNEWTPLDHKIYKLIRARALQSTMAPAKGQAAAVQFVSDDDPDQDYIWSTNARITTFTGWRAINQTVHKGDESSDDETTTAELWTHINTLKVGTKLQWSALEAQPHLTKAPARYNEATLVKALEERGIGRPSTFASLLAAIEDKGYVEKKDIEGKKVQLKRLGLKPGQWPPSATAYERVLNSERDRLVPTALGYQVLEFSLKHFDDLFNYDFTAAMESRLDKIADGNENYKAVLRETWAKYKDRYEALKSEKGSVPNAKERIFDDGVKAIMTRKGPMLLCEGAEKPTFYPWPSVGGRPVPFETITQEQVTKAIAAATAASIGDLVGHYKGEPMYKKMGKFGAYVTCNNVNVTWTANDTEESLATKFEAKAGAPKAQETRVGPFTFRVGPYGPYMYKTELKTKKFVNVPATINVAKLTVREADEIYQQGLKVKEEAKNKWKKTQV